MNATPEELAALAKLVGITPETHRHLYDEQNGWNPSTQSNKWLELRCVDIQLDTPAGDDVFLAPLMRFCGGGSNSKVDMWIEQWASNLTTMELIERCQSAGVPEIVSIFGKWDA